MQIINGRVIISGCKGISPQDHSVNFTDETGTLVSINLGVLARLMSCAEYDYKHRYPGEDWERKLTDEVEQNSREYNGVTATYLVISTLNS